MAVYQYSLNHKVTWNEILSSALYSKALWNGVGRYVSAVLGLASSFTWSVASDLSITVSVRQALWDGVGRLVSVHS